MTMSLVYVRAKCKGWASTTQQRVSPPIWSLFFYFSLNSFSSTTTHRCQFPQRNPTWLSLLHHHQFVGLVRCCGRVICMSFLSCIRLTNDSHSTLVNMWARLFDAAIIVMVCNHSSWSGITYELGYAYSWTIFAWPPNANMEKKTHQHLNVSVLSASILLRPFSAVGFAFAIINVVHESNENSNCWDNGLVWYSYVCGLKY